MSDLSPVNYSTNVVDPFAAAMQGYAGAAAIRDDQQNQVLKQQQQVQAQQQQQVIQSLMAKQANGTATAADYANTGLAVPGMKEQIMQGHNLMNTEQQASQLDLAGQAFAAMQSGDNPLAQQLITTRAAAMEAANGGNPTPLSQALRTKAQLIGINPQIAQASIGAMLSGTPGGDKVVQGAIDTAAANRAQELQPAALLTAGAKASKDVSEAAVAGNTVGALSARPTLQNQQTEQEIAASQAQQNVNALNVQIAQANSETDRGKLVLQRDEWQQKADQLKQTQTAGATSALDTLNNTRATVSTLLNHPSLSTITGGLGRYKPLPATGSYDFNSLLGTLKSQQFLSQLDALKQTSANGSSGLGALSDSEGDRLSNSIANLDPSQSNAQLTTNLKTILTTLDRAQARMLANGKLPGTTPSAGGAVVTTHPVYGNVTDAQVNALLQANPGSTRADVIKFLQQQPAGQ